MGSSPIFFASDDFIKRLDSIYFLIVSVVLSLICIHQAFKYTQFEDNNTYFGIFLRAIAIMILLNLNFYYDPNIHLPSAETINYKMFIFPEIVDYFAKPLLSTYFPLLSLIIFYFHQINKTTKVSF